MNCIRLVLVCVKLKNCFKSPTMQSILLAECYFWKYQTFVHKLYFFEHHLVWVIKTSAKKTKLALKQKKKVRSSASLNWAAQVLEVYVKWQMHVCAVLTKIVQGFWLSLLLQSKGEDVSCSSCRTRARILVFPIITGKGWMAQRRSTQATLFHHGPLWEMSPPTRTPMVRLCSARKRTHYCPGTAAGT